MELSAENIFKSQKFTRDFDVFQRAFRFAQRNSLKSDRIPSKKVIPLTKSNRYKLINYLKCLVHGKESDLKSVNRILDRFNSNEIIFYQKVGEDIIEEKEQYFIGSHFFRGKVVRDDSVIEEVVKFKEENPHVNTEVYNIFETQRNYFVVERTKKRIKQHYNSFYMKDLTRRDELILTNVTKKRGGKKSKNKKKIEARRNRYQARFLNLEDDEAAMKVKNQAEKMGKEITPISTDELFYSNFTSHHQLKKVKLPAVSKKTFSARELEYNTRSLESPVAIRRIRNLRKKVPDVFTKEEHINFDERYTSLNLTYKRSHIDANKLKRSFVIKFLIRTKVCKSQTEVKKLLKRSKRSFHDVFEDIVENEDF